MYESYLSQILSGKIVVIALGTNGLVTDELIDTLMADIGTERYVVFVNTRHPQPWLADTNAALQRATERYDNVHLVDWYSYSEGRDDLFDGDGTHLKASGAKEYVQLVYNAVREELPIHPEDMWTIRSPRWHATPRTSSYKRFRQDSRRTRLANRPRAAPRKAPRCSERSRIRAPAAQT